VVEAPDTLSLLEQWREALLDGHGVEPVLIEGRLVGLQLTIAVPSTSLVESRGEAFEREYQSG